MIRKSLAAVLLLVAASALAQNRGHAAAPPFNVPGTTVSGIVTAVNGNNVSLANGLVVLDISQATITDDHGGRATVATGSMIFAILRSTTSLQATNVVVTTVPQVTLSGPVQSINASAGTLQVLGLTIHTDANTSFGGGHMSVHLSDIAVNDVVLVQANAVGSNLLATSILVFDLTPQTMPTLLHGTVKSIGTNSWVITDSSRGDVTVVVNAQTRILGSPKVGDTVDVLVNVDSAHNYVAISITVSIQIQVLSGVVKSQAAILSPPGGSLWVIGPAVGLGPDFLVQVNAQTRLIGNPQIGDHVVVIAQQAASGFVALSITKQ